MRDLSPDFAAHLKSGATTLCSCWLIQPRLGAALGFTDHDVDIAFDGVTFEASSGFTASGLDQSLGLAIDNAAAQGALISDRITEEDIRRGRFDGAEIFNWMVNWSDPAQRVLMFRGELGDIRRGETAFEVELRGLSERLNRPTGRNYLPTCDAALGDVRCGVDIEDPAFKASAAVVEVINAKTLIVSNLQSYAPGWFAEGVLTWSSGALLGDTARVLTHRLSDADVIVTFDRDQMGVLANDEFDIVAGCDKRKETCAAKFVNLLNFRGFPAMPGENWVTAYPVDGEAYQGGSRFG